MLRDGDAGFLNAILGMVRSEYHDDRSASMAAYMRNKFAFVGVQTPQRRSLMREAIRLNGFPQSVFDVARELWMQPEREFQYIACDLLSHPKAVPQMALNELQVLLSFVESKSWWDTIDPLAAHAIGGVLLRHEHALSALTDRWIADANFWVQRTALLCQLSWKKRTNATVLFSLVLRSAHSKEFFVRKAAGWALREYSRTDSVAVRTFLDEHQLILSPLTLREAGKYC
jgi:3-methyladenine DNA glycosylase AlkD